MSVELKPGARVKNYTLERQLGKGASGEVWKAYNSQKTVAIKFMNENLMSSPSAAKHRARLEREIEAMRRLQHPNIPTLFDYDLDFVRPYIAMRYVGGNSYDRVIADGSMLRVPLVRRLELIRELAFALEAAHDYGIVHRDIKPANITGIENPFLLDFSVALERGEADATQRFIGTTLYMSPDGEVDRLSDNYSFALVTYEMLFGKHPIYKPGDPIFNQYVAAERLAKGDWRWPSRIPLAELPQDLRNANLQLLDDVFNRAFGKRETRYKDLRDFTRDLRDAIFPEMKTVVPAAQEDYIPTMMMQAAPVAPPPPAQPAPAAPAQPAPAATPFTGEGGTLVVPAVKPSAPPAAPPPAPVAPAAEYDVRTVAHAEHKTVPYNSLKNAGQNPPEILKTELDAPASPAAPLGPPAQIQHTELDMPAVSQAAPPLPATPVQPGPQLYTDGISGRSTGRATGWPGAQLHDDGVPGSRPAAEPACPERQLHHDGVPGCRAATGPARPEPELHHDGVSGRRAAAHRPAERAKLHDDADAGRPWWDVCQPATAGEEEAIAGQGHPAAGLPAAGARLRCRGHRRRVRCGPPRLTHLNLRTALVQPPRRGDQLMATGRQVEISQPLRRRRDRHGP